MKSNCYPLIYSSLVLTHRDKIFETHPWDTRRVLDISQGRTPWWAISTILCLTTSGKGRPFTNTPPSWFTPPWPVTNAKLEQSRTIETDKEMNRTLVIWHEFSCCDDTNAWRKSTKEADKHKLFYCNLESKNLSMHWCHHTTNSRQSASDPLHKAIFCA